MNENELRSMLANIYEEIKVNQDALSNVMDQLTSLRDVLAEASPGFATALESRLAYWQTLNAPLRADSNKGYDETIRSLRGL